MEDVECDSKTHVAAKCCGGCHHEEHQHEPSVPASPSPCHDCFCTGALPCSPSTVLDTFEATENIQPVAERVLARCESNNWTVDAEPDGIRPAGQTMLRNHCAYLL
jgi:hypothetical protein